VQQFAIRQFLTLDPEVLAVSIDEEIKKEQTNLSTLPSSATTFPGSQNAAPPAPNAPVQPAFSSQNSFQSGQSLAGQGFAGVSGFEAAAARTDQAALREQEQALQRIIDQQNAINFPRGFGN